MPEKSFVPALVTRLICAPPLRPVSAVKLVSCTFTSPTASGFIEWLETSGRPMSLPGIPSMVTVLQPWRVPPTFGSHEPMTISPIASGSGW